jgi:hypothetical protein
MLVLAVLTVSPRPARAEVAHLVCTVEKGEHQLTFDEGQHTVTHDGRSFTSASITPERVSWTENGGIDNLDHGGSDWLLDRRSGKLTYTTWTQTVYEFSGPSYPTPRRDVTYKQTKNTCRCKMAKVKSAQGNAQPVAPPTDVQPSGGPRDQIAQTYATSTEDARYQRLVSGVLTKARDAILRDGENRPADLAKQPEAAIALQLLRQFGYIPGSKVTQGDLTILLRAYRFTLEGTVNNWVNEKYGIVDMGAAIKQLRASFSENEIRVLEAEFFTEKTSNPTSRCNTVPIEKGTEAMR